MPPTKPPTLRSLAVKAGVSATAVSLALRGSPQVSAATRERLQKLAREAGYRSNPLVSAVFANLRRHKPRGDHAVIAYLNTWWPKHTWESCNTKSGQFRGAARRAAELGFRLENFWLREPGMYPARLAQIFRARGIKGVIVGPLQDQDRLAGFPWDQFALATMGYSLHSPAIARACHAHFRGMGSAMDRLIAGGYKRIGYVTSEDFEDRVSSLWGAAYRFNQHRLKPSDRIEPLVYQGEAEPGLLRRWLALSRPDAVINALPDVFELLAKLRAGAPPDLGFVHLDLPAHLNAAGVCGIDQLSEIVGANALELVANQLYTDTCGVPEHPVTQLVEGVWTNGDALAKGRKKRPAGRPAPAR
jgi:LacI family transcriptional regulator